MRMETGAKHFQRFRAWQKPLRLGSLNEEELAWMRRAGRAVHR
jgi:hypothetical protein